MLSFKLDIVERVMDKFFHGKYERCKFELDLLSYFRDGIGVPNFCDLVHRETNARFFVNRKAENLPGQLRSVPLFFVGKARMLEGLV